MIRIYSQALSRSSWYVRTCAMLLMTALWLSPAQVLAQTVAFSELENELWRHPSLMAQEFDALAERESAQAAYGLPDPELSLGMNNLPINDPAFDRFLPSNKAVGIRVQLPSRAGRDALASEGFARADRIDLVRRARFCALRAQLIVALVEREAAREQRALSTRRLDKYGELLSVSRAQIDAGQPAFYRLAQIESERAQVARELAQFDGDLARIDAQLIDLVGATPASQAPTLLAANAPPQADRYHAVQIARAQVDVTTQSVALAKAAWRPQWGAQLSYQQRTSGRTDQGAEFSGDDWLSGQLTVSLPVWASRRQQPKLRAAEATRASARSSLAAAHRFATAQYDIYAAQITAAASSRTALTRQIAAIERQTDAMLSVYESGEGSYAPVIDGEIAVLKLRGAVIAEDAHAQSALAWQQALEITP